MKIVLNNEDLNRLKDKGFSKIIDKAESVEVYLNLNSGIAKNSIKNLIYNGTSIKANIEVSKSYRRLQNALNFLIGNGVSQIRIVLLENTPFPKIIEIVNKMIRKKSAWWADISVNAKQEPHKQKQLGIGYKRKYAKLLIEEQKLLEEIKKVKEAKFLIEKFLRLKEKLQGNIKEGEPFYDLEQEMNSIFVELRKIKEAKPLLNKFLKIQNQKKDCLKKYNDIIKKLTVQPQKKIIKTLEPKKRIKESKLESYIDDSFGIAKPWKSD